MNRKSVKKLLIVLLTMTCLNIGVGCSETVKLARPPLPDKPHLGSLCQDKNDRNNEPGWWINDPDMRNLTKAWEGVEAVKDGWK
jgi:hypothetical protein